VTRFAGLRALVTGGGRGIGRATAHRLAAEGATVVVADLDAAAAAAVAAEVGGEPLVLDVADPAGMAAADPGALDVLVVNAGIQTFAPVTELAAADWDRVLAVNARGGLLTLQLGARTVADGGAIVTTASIQGLLPNPLSAHYAASKAALLSLTRTFAAELAPRRIRVNAVAPGRIDTRLSELANAETGRITGRDPAAALAERLAGNPLGRTGTPAEVAAAIAFLASADAGYITGEVLHVCGGDVMP
jgi:NAD(P)-dependent dehydrogenase (short-subunit alcohol dehydrogenase family)